jgi:hypothetical protein
MTDAEVAQWFFYLERVSQVFNWPIHLEGLGEAKRALDAAVASKAPADDVLEAYKKFAGAVGPTAMNSLLQSDDAFEEVNHSDKPAPPAGGKVTLYVDPSGKRVLGEVVLTHGMPPVFSVE